MELLPLEEINQKLKTLPDWIYIGNSISKEYKTKNFVEAVTLLMKIAVEAEKLDHHPDVLIHSYNKIKISLSTHSKGGVTGNDFKLAEIIEQILS
jgi:4a-hydroxytetrahydrobiopterin dehydratase